MNKKKGEVLERGKKIEQFQELLLNWFCENGRTFYWRKEKLSCYEIVISEIFLQRTRAEKVDGFLKSFFSDYNSWEKIKVTPEEEIQDFIKPMGLWGRRAKTLKKLSIEMVKRDGKFPNSKKELLKLPGVGQYVCNAVLLFCKGIPAPLLDVNMARVLERVFGPRKLSDIRYDPYLQELSLDVVRHEKSKEINWGILDIGAKFCLAKKTNCKLCPLNKICHYFEK